MAGAGYKLFNTGDVLTAAQVNTYLMQQTVMVFASSAARTSALSGVLAEGMVSYLQDTNTLEVYDGSAWVGATGDITGLTAGTGISISSATGPVPTITSDVATTFDAKGDLVVGTGADTFAKLTVGNSGDTIVADSSATTGLRWQGDYAAGKNKIINGDFALNQRAFTSTTTSTNYGFDRWLFVGVDGTTTYSAQTFTAGAAPVAGYEAINFARLVTTGQTATNAFSFLEQKIEDVRTYANQTVTVSFWAKAATGTPKIAIELDQQFGSGGSTRVATAVGQPTISTSWARYSASVLVPSISGKTIGSGNSLNLNLIVSAGSDFNARTGSLGIQSNTFDIWGVQVEAGSVATAFQTATGTLAGELAAAQRYFERYEAASGAVFYTGFQQTSTAPRISASIYAKRSTPTITTGGAGTLQVMVTGGTTYNATSIDAISYSANGNTIGFRANIASGGTAGDACALYASGGAVTLDYSSEL